MTISDIAVEGIHRAESRVQSVAERVARPTTPSGAISDQIDLSEVAVKLMQSKNEVAIDVKLIQTADQMGKAILDILA